MSAAAGAAQDLAAHALADAVATFHRYKEFGDRALAQLDDDAQVVWSPDPESNSIAVIVRHLRGNLRSRWTDVLTTDGEKPDRRRDEEFELGRTPGRAEVLGWWDEGWRYVFDAMATLRPADLMRTVTIRGEPHTLLQALNRSLTHVAQHVGQIIWIAKSLKGGKWETLTIPRRKRA